MDYMDEPLGVYHQVCLQQRRFLPYFLDPNSSLVFILSVKAHKAMGSEAKQ